MDYSKTRSESMVSSEIIYFYVSGERLTEKVTSGAFSAVRQDANPLPLPRFLSLAELHLFQC